MRYRAPVPTLSSTPTQAASPALPLQGAVRFDRLDALRGVAIVWMAGFHFSFDLNRYGLMQPPQQFLTDPFWTLQRTAIVSLFLFCAGLGQAVALGAGQSWARFWRRWAQVAGCAVLVTAGSWLMFPQSPITFGVLHGIAAMLLIVRLLAPLTAHRPGGGLVWLVLGAAALLLPQLWGHPFFDTRWTNWVGLVTHLPFTQDYVPVLPWLGVVMAGVAAGQWLLSHRPGVLAGAVPAALRPLALLGRWSLSFYMLHQPVLVGVTLGLAALARS
jgi:uncharacterized membrane protein